MNTETKTIREWLEMLPEPYRTQAITQANLYVLGEQEDYLHTALMCSHNWVTSNEGFEYWHILHEALKTAEITNSLTLYLAGLKEEATRNTPSQYADHDVYNSKPSDKSILGGSYPALSSTVEPNAVQYLFKSDIGTLTTQIQQWAVDRNLQTSDKKSQFVKVAEEVGEIAAAIARGDNDLLQDAIGDVFVTIVILSQCSGLDFTECVQQAYNEIKDRKGKLVDGIFIKEG